MSKKAQHQNNKSIAFISQSELHHVDHLAVIAIIMGFPLVFLDPEIYALGKKYYPELNAVLMDEESLSSEYLIANYDAWFTSALMKQETFRKVFSELEKKYQKKLRRVFCPHGFSDKGSYFKLLEGEDIFLIYGQNMLEMFNEYGILKTFNSYAVTGNYRYTYFKKHLEFFKKTLHEDFGNRLDQTKPTILYAPTRTDDVLSSTLQNSYESVFRQLSNDFNLIVKVHPLIEIENPGLYYHILGKYESRPNVVIIKDYPLVYPLLMMSDIYLGDASSVGYDYLAFNRPMFFLRKPLQRQPYDNHNRLLNCGQVIHPDELSNIQQIIKEHLPEDQKKFSKIRSDLYEYTFGKEMTFSEIRSNITKSYEISALKP